MTDVSPIALFTYNRPTHTKSTLDALAANDLAQDSMLTVFCDGPRSADDEAAIAEVRDVARAAKGFKQVEIVERPENLGLARSVITGVSAMLDASETVIVMEDDLVTSPSFLRFMNDALRFYADDERVISACAYSYPVRGTLPETYFLLGAHCWGWATWRRGWALFENDAEKLLAALVNDDDMLYEFDRAGSYPHTQYLQRTAAGEGDSWALRWMASAVMHGKLTLYPGRSLVSNIGMDSSGTNAPELEVYQTGVADASPRIGESVVQQDGQARRLLRAFHVKWRKTWKLKFRVYYLLTALLPEGIEKVLYARVVRRALRRLRSGN